MSTAILELRFKPDSVDEALGLFHPALEDTRAFEGCLGVTVVQDNDDPAHLLFIEQWRSLDHDRAYRRWRAGDGAIVGLAELLAAPPSLTIGATREDV